MPLKCYANKKVKVDHTRYHMFYVDEDPIAVSATKEWNVKKQLAAADSYEVCVEERCLLCWSYDLAKIPMIEVGEVLAFTNGNLEDIVIVVAEFDPCDDEINTLEDLIDMGYARPIKYLEIWDDDDY